MRKRRSNKRDNPRCEQNHRVPVGLPKVAEEAVPSQIDARRREVAAPRPDGSGLQRLRAGRAYCYEGQAPPYDRVEPLHKDIVQGGRKGNHSERIAKGQDADAKAERDDEPVPESGKE